MALSVFQHVSLAAVCAVVPAGRITLEDEAAFYGNSPERLARFAEASGLRSRRVAPEGVTASDLCRQAAETLLAEGNVDRASIGAVIFISQASDYLLPATAAALQHALGISSDCAAMDMTVGCAGYVTGLWVGAGLIASGACSRVLLLVGDTPNRFLDPANRVTSPIFGDAGTATLLERRESAPGMSFLMGTNGAGQDALIIPGGGSRIPHLASDGPESSINQVVTDAKGNPWTLGGYGKIWMDGMAVYSFSLSVVPSHLKRHMNAAGVRPQDLDRLFLHPANKIIADSLIKKTGIPPEKAPLGTLAEYGNLGAASVPVMLCDTLSRDGEKGAPLNMLCGFGAGLSWGSCLLSLEECRVHGVHEFSPSEDIPTREELIACWHKKFSRDGA